MLYCIVLIASYFVALCCIVLYLLRSISLRYAVLHCIYCVVFRCVLFTVQIVTFRKSKTTRGNNSNTTLKQPTLN